MSSASSQSNLDYSDDDMDDNQSELEFSMEVR